MQKKVPTLGLQATKSTPRKIIRGPRIIMAILLSENYYIIPRPHFYARDLKNDTDYTQSRYNFMRLLCSARHFKAVQNLGSHLSKNLAFIKCQIRLFGRLNVLISVVINP